MEAPNATIQMDEQTRQNEQAAQFIRFMQVVISNIPILSVTLISFFVISLSEPDF